MATYASASSKYAGTATAGRTYAQRKVAGQTTGQGLASVPSTQTEPKTTAQAVSQTPPEKPYMEGYPQATTMDPYRGPSVPAAAINSSGNVSPEEIHAGIQRGLAIAAMSQQQKEKYVQSLSPAQARQTLQNPLTMQYAQTTIYQTPLEQRQGRIEQMLTKQSNAYYPIGPAGKTRAPASSLDVYDSWGKESRPVPTVITPTGKPFTYNGVKYWGPAAAAKITELSQTATGQHYLMSQGFAFDEESNKFRQSKSGQKKPIRV